MKAYPIANAMHNHSINVNAVDTQGVKQFFKNYAKNRSSYLQRERAHGQPYPAHEARPRVTPGTRHRRHSDRAPIATLTYSFARIGAALKMKVEDLRPQGANWRLRLHEKGGKHHTMPCHHALAEVLHAYITAASIAMDRKGWLFRTGTTPPCYPGSP